MYAATCSEQVADVMEQWLQEEASDSSRSRSCRLYKGDTLRHLPKPVNPFVKV